MTSPFKLKMDKITELSDNFVDIMTSIESGDYCDNLKIEMLKLYREQTRDRISELLGAESISVLISVLVELTKTCSSKYKTDFLTILEHEIRSFANIHESSTCEGSQNDEIYEQLIQLRRKFEILEKENLLLREELEIKAVKITQIELLKSKLRSENIKLGTRITMLNEDLADIHKVVKEMSFQLEESKKVILTMEQDMLLKNERLEIYDKELINQKEECDALKTKLNSRKEMSSLTDCECKSKKIGEFLINEDILSDESQILTESCRSIVTSTRKNLQDDLSEALKNFSLPDLEDVSSLDELENESNIYDKVSINNQEDSGLEISELVYRLSDLTADMNISSSKKCQDESPRWSEEERRNPVHHSPPAPVGDDVRTELQREQLRSQLEEVSQEIYKLEVRKRLK